MDIKEAIGYFGNLSIKYRRLCANKWTYLRRREDRWEAYKRKYSKSHFRLRSRLTHSLTSLKMSSVSDFFVFQTLSLFVFSVFFFFSNDPVSILLTNCFLLVSISISLLREELVTKLAFKWSQTSVGPNVVLYVTNFCKLLVAKVTAKHLI